MLGHPAYSSQWSKPHPNPRAETLRLAADPHGGDALHARPDTEFLGLYLVPCGWRLERWRDPIGVFYRLRHRHPGVSGPYMIHSGACLASLGYFRPAEVVDAVRALIEEFGDLK